jgi:quinoprotein glucose dehydrogenase
MHFSPKIIISDLRSFRVREILIVCLCSAFVHLFASENKVDAPRIFPASDEAERALKGIHPASGLRVDLFAAEPLVVNPVSFSFDRKGRIYVVETFRRRAGVLEIESRADWEDPAITKILGKEVVENYMLAEDLACRTVEENIAFLRRHFGSRADSLSGLSERIQLVTPGADGKPAESVVFAEGFDHIGDGVAAGVLPLQSKVLFACIPDLWELSNREGEQTAERKSLQHGYGVHVGSGAHSLHGLRIGPDGKLYFSVGDRGASVLGWDGSRVSNPDSGAVFRCNVDGSRLELFATGLRNPQSLAFDQFGNLFTGDNNSDAGDPSRWVYVVEGGDSGWRVGYQHIDRPAGADTLAHPPQSRGAWLNEGQCYPFFEGQAAFLVPPVANIANGPSGVAFYPGVGLPPQYDNHFFLCDFKGAAANSLIHSFAIKGHGAGFEMIDRDVLVSNVLPTDVGFGPDCRIYFSDWVNGWPPPGKGRLYRLFDESRAQSALVLETKTLIAEGMEHRSQEELIQLLSHPDQRVRQEAQFALADTGAVDALKNILQHSSLPIARIHALWALGQIADIHVKSIADESASPLNLLVPILGDHDAEVAAQAAKVLGSARFARATGGLHKLLLEEGNPRARYFAALGLGKIGRKDSVPSILEMLRADGGHDPFLRHAGVMALVWIADLSQILSAAHDESPAVRMASLLALRRFERPEVALFLHDQEPKIVLEAARAVTDAGIYSALPEVAEMISQTNRWTGFPDGSDGRTNLLTPLLRRIVNANFRTGDFQNARALAQFATLACAPENVRFEALQGLSRWEHPSPLDQITGLYRPLPARDTRIVGEAIRPFVGEVLHDSSTALRIAAAKLASHHQIKEAKPELSRLLDDKNVDSRVRAECLAALSSFTDDATFLPTLQRAELDSNELVRIEASRIRAELSGFDIEKLDAILESGSTAEQQNALASLGALRGPAVERLLSKWLDRFFARKLKPELQLDLLEAAQKQTAPTLKAKIVHYEESLLKIDPLAPFRNALYGGSAAEGKRIFLEKPEVACIRCHKIGAEGNEVGPVLTSVGARLNRETILESIVYPNKQIATGFETTLIRLKDGTVQAGIIKGEDASEVNLVSPDSGLIKIKKADILERERGLSGMPEGFGEILTRRELRNLVEFLANQR